MIVSWLGGGVVEVYKYCVSYFDMIVSNSLHISF